MNKAKLLVLFAAVALAGVLAASCPLFADGGPLILCPPRSTHCQPNLP